MRKLCLIHLFCVNVIFIYFSHNYEQTDRQENTIWKLKSRHWMSAHWLQLQFSFLLFKFMNQNTVVFPTNVINGLLDTQSSCVFMVKKRIKMYDDMSKANTVFYADNSNFTENGKLGSSSSGHQFNPTTRRMVMVDNSPPPCRIIRQFCISLQRAKV